MFITNDIKYIGVNDHKVDLFEGQYVVKNGISYNSYVIFDDKIAVMDTVDRNFTHEWLDNLEKVLGNRKPDYLIISHMEPDHSANIKNFVNTYPDAIVVGNAKAFSMINQFFNLDLSGKKLVVEDGDSLSLGRHVLNFVFAPMVHWPEVMVTYDSYDKVLFSADAFGKFGAIDVEEDWLDEARRYYIGIVAKYGMQVSNLLKKASALDIEIICPLHGPVLNDNLGYYLEMYRKWSAYEAEIDGILIAYTSVYGNTAKACDVLKNKLINSGCPKVEMIDLARTDMSQAVALAFAYGKIILATTTYNATIFPYMNDFIEHLIERNFQNKVVGFVENGSWGPLAAKIMKEKLTNCKNLSFTANNVHIKSALNETSKEQIDKLVTELCKEYIALDSSKANKNDLSALFNIGYGLYVVTSNDGKRDNGLIVNTVAQLTSSPQRIGVTINKENYSHHVIMQTKKMNVCCLSVEAPFKVFEDFGFRSGRSVDKFDNVQALRSDNGLLYLAKYINSFISLVVEETVDLGTHTMFICSITESRVISDKETMTYTYYQNNVKPKPKTEGKKGYVCKICGFVYEGEELPDDYVCPLCKHGASDFEPIE